MPNFAACAAFTGMSEYLPMLLLSIDSVLGMYQQQQLFELHPLALWVIIEPLIGLSHFFTSRIHYTRARNLH